MTCDSGIDGKRIFWHDASVVAQHDKIAITSIQLGAHYSYKVRIDKSGINILNRWHSVASILALSRAIHAKESAASFADAAISTCGKCGKSGTEWSELVSKSRKFVPSCRVRIRVSVPSVRRSARDRRIGRFGRTLVPDCWNWWFCCMILSALVALARSPSDLVRAMYKPG